MVFINTDRNISLIVGGKLEMKYCKFFKSIWYGKQLMWKKNRSYLVTSENEQNYYFGDPIESGIAKKDEGIAYKVIIKKEEI